jgi:hypothetical protein
MIYWAKIDSAKEQSFSLISSNKLATDETKVFLFNESQYNKLNWAEQDKEFTCNGQHYDIVNIKNVNGQIKVTCYSDNTETEIANAFNNLLQKFFSPVQQSKNTENNIAGKIYKEYLPIDYLMVPVLQNTSISFVSQHKDCISFSAIADIWHPPANC